MGNVQPVVADADSEGKASDAVRALSFDMAAPTVPEEDGKGGGKGPGGTAEPVADEKINEPTAAPCPKRRFHSVLGERIRLLLDRILHPPPPPPQTGGLYTPKQLLWGCESAEEHHARVREAVKTATKSQGSEGLSSLGFEFRMVHNPATCCCEDAERIDSSSSLDSSAEEEEEDVIGKSSVGGSEAGADWAVGPNRDDRRPEGSVGDGSYMVPIKGDDNEPVHRVANGRKKKLDRSMTSVIESTIDRLGRQDDMVDSTPPASPARLSASKASNASLFSLVTHHTRSSTHSNPLEAECALRLFHIPSGSTLISERNYQQFVANGVMYDEIARLCMEYAQEVMIEEGRLHWVTVCDARNICALVSEARSASSRSETSDAGKRRKILLVVTGKGKVRAGIFSRRHLITTGAEAATAIPLVRDAVRRNMEIVILDPNAIGDRAGMEAVEASLEHLFDMEEQEEEEEIYVLAHSMAGAQLVRYLHEKSSQSLDTPINGGNGSDTPSDTVAQQIADRQAASSLVRSIKAVAFTDSNHNINWTKTNPALTNLLVGPSCLYVKSHKRHDDPKDVGEDHHDCHHWRHRFGDVRTMWAGTHEHALTNYTARFHIWDHFEQFFHPGDREDHNGISDEEKENAPTF